MIFKAVVAYLEQAGIPLILLNTATFLVLWIWIPKVLAWIRCRKKLPPGPVGIPILGYLPFLGPKPYEALWDMRSKYRDIIGLYFGRRYTVVLNTFEVAKEVLCHPAALDRQLCIFDPDAELGFSLKNGDEWREQRSFCFSAAKDLGFGKSQWEDFVAPEIESFVSELRSTCGKPTDSSLLWKKSICTNVVSMLIGRQLQKDKEADVLELAMEYPHAIFASAGVTNPVNLVPGARELCKLLNIGGYGRAARVIREFQDFIKKEISMKKHTKEDNKDFINLYFEKTAEVNKTSSHKHYFSEKALAGNLNIILGASVDTVTGSLVYLLRLMAKHKDVQGKVHKELSGVLGRDERVRFTDRQKIPYTYAVLLELQRFISIVSISTTRNAIYDIEVKGFTIPKGSDIVSNLWGLHHDPAYWQQPDKFIPERFLSEDGSCLLKNIPSFAPFSLGKRKCPGENISMMGILAYFSEIIRNFEVTTEPGVEPEFKEIISLINSLEPQPLCFIPRVK